MTIYDIIKAAIPNANDEICSYILWERTPYPVGKITARTLFSSARRYKRASDNNIQLCDFCDRIAETNKSVCSKCHKALII